MRQPEGDLAASSIAAEMAFDPASGQVLLVSPLLPPAGAGTSTWAWSGTAWHKLAAVPPTATSGLALDPASGTLLLCSDPTPVDSAQLWRWSGTVWARVPNSAITAAAGSEVTDTARAQLLFIGFVSSATQPVPQPLTVWRWIGTWQRSAG